MVSFKRWFRHAFMPPWRWSVSFPKQALIEIEAAIKDSEHLHGGEIRFAVENALPLEKVWSGVSARQRALEVFSDLRVWDTAKNSGVLVYVSVADREVHIVADRGVAGCVEQVEWDEIADIMEREYHQGNFLQGSLQGIARITTLLASHFSPDINNVNELSNKPFIV
jgi:uncharacterized membrane protein